MTKKEARAVVGGLSAPSKMPCYGWSTPASRCPLGAKLKHVKGTVCSICYADKNMYLFRNVQAALEKRWTLLMRALTEPDYRTLWREAFRTLLKGETEFRWHDSGDLQSVDHLRLVVDIALDNPHVRFWLPTRQIDFLQAYRQDGGSWPENLIIRLSPTKIGAPPPIAAAIRLGVLVSGVDDTDAFQCPAYTQGNNCGDCRACWDSSVFNVSYRAH